MKVPLPSISNPQPYMPFGHKDLPALSAGTRAVQALFVCLAAASFAMAAYLNPNIFQYDLSLILGICVAGGSCVGGWLIQIRSKRARPVCIAIIAIMNALLIRDFFGNGAITTLAGILGAPIAYAACAIEFAWALAAVMYLWRSKAAREALSCDYDYANITPGGHTWELPLLTRLRTWEFWRDLLIYFFAFSFLGHWAEIAFCWLIRFGLVMGDYDPSNSMLWNQWLFPFSAEGIALVMIVLVLHPFSRWILKKCGGRVPLAVIVSFFANAIVCTAIDFTTGITSNQDYHLWDYRNMPFNFMGQVCLQNSMVYSIAATLIVWVVYPLMDKGIRSLPKIIVDGAFWFLAGMYGFCAMLHFLYFTTGGMIFGQ
jgi:hypothetical protein